jgi:hypothetical protein
VLGGVNNIIIVILALPWYHNRMDKVPPHTRKRILDNGEKQRESAGAAAVFSRAMLARFKGFCGKDAVDG